MMISTNPNLSNSEHDSTLTLRRCKFWNCRKHVKLSTSSDMSSPIKRKNPNFTALHRRVCDFWKSIHKFAGKHFKLSTTTMRPDPSSANPNINIDSVPTLPFDLITEILSRLPVKLLLQLRSVCKSWNSLISNDPRFAKKHLTNSTTHSISSLNFKDPYSLIVYPPNFFFDTAISTKQIFYGANDGYWEKEIVGSCNGILCIAYKEFILLWNPSIRKIKELPLLPKPHYPMIMTYGFGYDSVTDNYKVVVVLWSHRVNLVEVKVNTMGTKIWKNIDEFPFGTVPYQQESGKYVSGTINWLPSSQRFIVSLDLGNESYQKLLLPHDYGDVQANSFLALILILDVLRDCLCIISGHAHDVWLMKEYGKEESWTKLFTISSYKQDPSLSFFLNRVIYVFEDGQVLLQMKMPFFSPQLIVYDPRIDTFEFVTFPNNFYKSRSDDLDVSKYGGLVVSIESLISPCS